MRCVCVLYRCLVLYCDLKSLCFFFSIVFNLLDYFVPLSRSTCDSCQRRRRRGKLPVRVSRFNELVFSLSLSPIGSGNNNFTNNTRIEVHWTFFFVQPSALWFDCRCFCSMFVSIFTPRVAVYWLLILFSSCSARLAFLGEFYGGKLRVFNFQSQEALDLHSYCLATTWSGLPRDIFNLCWEMPWFFLKIKIGLIFFQ